MDAADRLSQIQTLAEQAAAGRRNIEERIARREADPFSEHERLMADQRFTKDENDLVYSEPAGETDNSALLEASAGNGDASDAGDWQKQVAIAIGDVGYELKREMRAERAAEIAGIKQEIAELRGQVSALLAIVGKGGKK